MAWAAPPSQQLLDGPQQELCSRAIFPYRSRTNFRIFPASTAVPPISSRLSLPEDLSHHRAQRVLHQIAELLDFHHRQAAAFPLPLPGDEGELVPSLDPRPVAHVLREDHLAPVIHRHEGLHPTPALR